MTPGERLKTIRNMRHMTMKELGIAVGFPEENADIRIAQYESGRSIPRKNLMKQLAACLRVSPNNFSKHICETKEELFRSMIWIQEEYGTDAVTKCFNDWQDSYFMYDVDFDEEEDYEARKFK